MEQPLRQIIEAEVTHISRNGLILWVKGSGILFTLRQIPNGSKRAAVDDVFNVQLLGRERIRWDALDVDLSLSIIANPDKYPLVSK